jgi:general secretion pathway protein J
MPQQNLIQLRAWLNMSMSEKGFTLVEMLIAVTISAMVAALAYATFDAAGSNAGRTRTILKDVNQLDRTWQIIGQDLRNLVVPNNVQGQTQERGKQLTIIQTSPFTAASQKSKGSGAFQVLMQFERRGWMNPLGRPRSDLQLVNYRVAEGKLIRDFMPQLNMPMQDVDFERASSHQELLKGVTDVQLRFLSTELINSSGKNVLIGDDYSNTWDTTWPSLDHPSAGTPVAIEITVEVEKVGRSVRLFELPQ